MVTTTSRRAEQAGRVRPRRLARRRVIRQASAWLPSQDPQPVSLQDLEETDAIRWVDVYAGELNASELLALLKPVCRGQLDASMARQLVTAGRFPAGQRYGERRVAITGAFRIRHLQRRHRAVTSVFEPVHLLIGEGWLITAWLPPRVFRGSPEEIADGDELSNGLYLAVAEAWPGSDAETAADLAALARHELAVVCGYRPRAT